MSLSSNFSNQLQLAIHSVWLHPLGLIMAQCLIMLLLVGFTPARSPLRPILLPVVIGSAWITLYNSSKVIAGLSWTFVLQYIDLCLLSRWNLESEGPERSRNKSRVAVDEKRQPQSPGIQFEPEIAPSIATRVRFGWDSTFGYRHIGTPQESRNTPCFDKLNPGYIPTKRAFFVKQILAIVRCYLIIDFFSCLNQNRTWKEVSIFARIDEVTKEELIWRFIRVAGFWMTVQSLWIICYSVTSLIAVGFGLSEPQFWRPLFTSPAEAYSVRRFWGTSWHQILRRVMGNSASFICHDVLDVKDDFLARYIKLYLTFLISGLLHAAMDVGGGIPFDEQGSVRFLVTQAVGITAEDAVQAVYIRARGKQDVGKRAPLWTRIVGNVWTLAFLVWTTPAWFYPEANRREMNLIKFSILGLAKSYLM